MAKTKAQKKEITDKLEAAFKTAASAVFVHFKTVTVAEETAMRRDLRREGVGYTVAKKTLIRRALKALGHDESILPLEGEIAVAYNNAEGGDASGPARLIHGFAQKLKEKLVIAGGIFEGTLRDARAMQEIATIPSMEVLRGMFANIINSPKQRFAIALSEVAKTKAK
jgi:large subunit ribosomal protein L10